MSTLFRIGISTWAVPTLCLEPGSITHRIAVPLFIYVLSRIPARLWRQQ